MSGHGTWRRTAKSCEARPDPADGVPALADPFSATRADPPAQEQRWQTIGRVGPSAVLLVIHTDPVALPDGRAIGPHHQREKGDQA